MRHSRAGWSQRSYVWINRNLIIEVITRALRMFRSFDGLPRVERPILQWHHLVYWWSAAFPGGVLAINLVWIPRLWSIDPRWLVHYASLSEYLTPTDLQPVPDTLWLIDWLSMAVYQWMTKSQWLTKFEWVIDLQSKASDQTQRPTD